MIVDLVITKKASVFKKPCAWFFSFSFSFFFFFEERGADFLLLLLSLLNRSYAFPINQRILRRFYTSCTITLLFKNNSYI